MPLALLLKEHLGVLTAGVKKVAPLGSIMDRATLVLRRQQGAFLHAWFGPGLRIDGLDVAVAVVNAPAIQARVGHARDLQARRAEVEQGPGGGEAANLFMPAAGLAGVLAGTIVGGLLGAALSGTVVIGLLGLQFSFFSRLVGIVTGSRRLWAGYTGLYGDVGEESSDYLAYAAGGREAARWVDALTGLGRAALGPRPERPTTLRDALFVLLDRVTALVSQAIGAFATFAHLVPVVRALRAAVDPLLGLVGVGERIITAAVTDTITALADVVRANQIARLPGLLISSLGRAMATMVAFVGDALGVVRRPFSLLMDGVTTAWDAQGAPILQAVRDHPVLTFFAGLGSIGTFLARLGREVAGLFPSVVRNITPASVSALITAVKTVHGWFSSGSSGPGVASRAWSWARARLSSGGTPARIAPRRPVPITPFVAPLAAEAARQEMAELPLHIVGSVPRVFPAERARLEAELTRREADPAYRAATLVVEAAARLAGPEIDAAVGTLSARLDEIEASLVGRRRRPAPPVRDLPPPRRLVPMLRRVRVTGAPQPPDVTGGGTAEARAWVGEIVRQLGAAPFPVPAGGG